jgi:hypothetical protein
MSVFNSVMRQRINVASKPSRSAAVVPSRHMVQQRRGPAPAKGVQFSDQFMEVLSKSLEREESRVSAQLEHWQPTNCCCRNMSSIWQSKATGSLGIRSQRLTLCLADR